MERDARWEKVQAWYVWFTPYDIEDGAPWFKALVIEIEHEGMLVYSKFYFDDTAADAMLDLEKEALDAAVKNIDLEFERLGFFS